MNVANVAQAQHVPSAVVSSLRANAESNRYGSGFVTIRHLESGPEAFVVTNHHVIEYADTVELQFDDKSPLGGCQVVFDDRRRDLAVIGCEGLARRNIPWGIGPGEEEVRDQDDVVAVGFPAINGEASYQSSRGHVSNARYKDDNKLDWIQHTAPIDGGSSGGALLSKDGRLIGVNTLKIGHRDNVYFAIPGQ